MKIFLIVLAGLAMSGLSVVFMWRSWEIRGRFIRRAGYERWYTPDYRRLRRLVNFPLLGPFYARYLDGLLWKLRYTNYMAHKLWVPWARRDTYTRWRVLWGMWVDFRFGYDCADTAWLECDNVEGGTPHDAVDEEMSCWDAE